MIRADQIDVFAQRDAWVAAHAGCCGAQFGMRGPWVPALQWEPFVAAARAHDEREARTPVPGEVPPAPVPGPAWWAACAALLPGHHHCRHGHVVDCPDPGECPWIDPSACVPDAAIESAARAVAGLRTAADLDALIGRP